MNETDSSKNQVLNGTFDAIPGVPATGDGEVTMLSDGSMLHKFTRVGTYKLNFPTTGDSDIRFLLVGGGGSGGRTANERGGGGGGGGGVLSNSVSQLITIAAGTEMTVTVGAGGVAPTAAARGENGGNTSISFGSTTYTALGGGGGGTSAQLGVAGGNSGGSGGGTNGSRTSGQQRAIDGTTLVGKSGGGGTAYAAGGGGGGGENGQDAGSDQPNRGGNGTPCDITGEVVMYAGGGGGGLDNIIPKQNINCGGVGGGGWGAGFCVAGIYQAAQDGENVLGGGGGGGGTGSGWSAAQEKFWTAGNGGSGCAYIRYMPSTTLPAAPVLSVTASELSLEDFTSTISYKTWYPGPGVDAVALSYAVTVDDTEPTDWTLLDSAQIGSGELDLAFAEIGVTYRVWFKAVGGGTPVVSMTTVVMPEATEVTLDEPSVDKDNFTIRFTGSVDSIGVGTTTLQLHYGKNEALGKIFDCGTAVEGDDPFDFDTGAIACKVPGDRMALVYYRYVMVETVHGVEVARIETPVRSVRVIPNGLMVIYY